MNRIATIANWLKTWPGIITGVLAVMVAVGPRAYALVDIERASHSSTKHQVLLDSITAIRADQDSIRRHIHDLVVDTRQFTACNLWQVPADKCAAFRIPGAPR